MFRRSPRAGAFAGAALLVAIVTAALVVSSLSSLRHQDEIYGRLRPVVVATRDLRVGTTVARRDVTVRRLRGDAPVPDGVRSLAGARGRVVRVPVLRGTPVTTRHLAAPDRRGLAGVVPAGRRAVRLVVEHGLRPTAGDLVDVLATFDPATLGDGGDPTIVVAPAVPVVRVEQPTGSSDTVAVTVLASTAEARRLAFSAANATLALDLAPPEAAAP
jgi:Flp pilus assembly protein CpaB